MASSVGGISSSGSMNVTVSRASHQVSLGIHQQWGRILPRGERGNFTGSNLSNSVQGVDFPTFLRWVSRQGSKGLRDGKSLFLVEGWEEEE